MDDVQSQLFAAREAAISPIYGLIRYVPKIYSVKRGKGMF